MTTKELIALAKKHYPQSPIAVHASLWNDGRSDLSLWVAELNRHFNGETIQQVADNFMKFQARQSPEAATIIEEISNGNQPL